MSKYQKNGQKVRRCKLCKKKKKKKKTSKFGLKVKKLKDDLHLKSFTTSLGAKVHHWHTLQIKFHNASKKHDLLHHLAVAKNFNYLQKPPLNPQGNFGQPVTWHENSARRLAEPFSLTLWDALGCFGMLWDALGCFGMLWDALGCFQKHSAAPVETGTGSWSADFQYSRSPPVTKYMPTACEYQNISVFQCSLGAWKLRFPPSLVFLDKDGVLCADPSRQLVLRLEFNIVQLCVAPKAATNPVTNVELLRLCHQIGEGLRTKSWQNSEEKQLCVQQREWSLLSSSLATLSDRGDQSPFDPPHPRVTQGSM